ncbi:hypothetical protein NSA47_05230 [Irregularibacter muris]|uniref:Ethanolamine utilization protein n=1 Tax=Irregularibacter muris TaxID=1796619 RepID=A0AAE3HE13_9FIRM|nr:hypothetical protein [Irregularibacter muris]MCR1898391.1 hypothetical protein [Irregularibacter muris]
MQPTIDIIVKEVIKRIKALQCQKKILLVLKDSTDFSTLRILMKKIIDRNYEFEVLSLLQNNQEEYQDPIYKNMTKLRSTKLEDLKGKELIKDYQGMILSNVSLRELKNIKDLDFEDSLGGLIYETLKANKPVYCLSEDLQDIKNPGLAKKINSFMTELREIGVRVVQHNLSMENKINKIPEQPPKNIQDKPILHQKFITLRDIKGMEYSINHTNSKVIHIAKDSKLTMEAEDYIDEKNMIMRRI